MTTSEIVKNKILEFAQAPLPDDDDASLFDLGVIDSFGLMNLINSLELVFNTKVPDADLTPRRFETVAKITAYFDGKMA